MVVEPQIETIYLSETNDISGAESNTHLRVNVWLRVINKGKNMAQNLRADIAVDQSNLLSNFPKFQRALWERPTEETENETNISYLDERRITLFANEVQIRKRKDEYDYVMAGNRFAVIKRIGDVYYYFYENGEGVHLEAEHPYSSLTVSIYGDDGLENHLCVVLWITNNVKAPFRMASFEPPVRKGRVVFGPIPNA